MRRFGLIMMLFAVGQFTLGQEISVRLQEAVKHLENDSQLKSGMISFHVVEQKTGKVVFDKNGQIGMPVASSQKVLTSVAALEILGEAYRYRTTLGYSGTLQDGILYGNLYLNGSGDPTLGSWRYGNTKEQIILGKWVKAVTRAGIKQVQGEIIGKNTWETQTISGGWIWDDIGNYYGAGVTSLNWRENQYDLKLKSGSRVGDSVRIVTTAPKLYGIVLQNELTAGKPGSGDNAYIYLSPYSSYGYIRGTIPAGESSFTVSGSFPDPGRQLTNVFKDELQLRGIQLLVNNVMLTDNNYQTVDLVSHLSPPLDSINYWFLRKSINLYGEAFLKTLGKEKAQNASAKDGITVIKNFWKDKGIDPTSINIYDGSGLSPQNRVTTEALAKVMRYAKTQPYFNSFYNALPEFNGIKMKSGTIGGVKSFTGYLNGYTFAVVINNFNGSTSSIVRKMYALLDLLK